LIAVIYKMVLVQILLQKLPTVVNVSMRERLIWHYI